MCGINGLYYFDANRAVESSVIDRMRAVATHRGPDDLGIHCQGNAGIGFNRLSIIDLSGGHQPMSNEDGTVWIAFNGEIYNFQPLREELIRRGHVFATKSDTETIVHAWEEYGERCVDQLRGMFAFAIWDSRRRVMFAARDRLGIKPLYYYSDNRQFAFASELKSLLEAPGIPVELNERAIGEFLRRRYVIAPNTMLRNIFKLEPGHWIRADQSGIRVERYWDLPKGEVRDISDKQALEELDHLLTETTRIHLISDVPLGAFLSGGLDSSCTVGLMSKIGVEKIKTFSIGYDSPESELGYAKIVADHFKTEHHELRLTPVDFRDTLPLIAWHMDEPVGDQASIPLFYLSKFARQEVTVVLSGEGADEIFAGYDIYRRMLRFEDYNRAPLSRAAGTVLGAMAGDTPVGKYVRMLGQPVEVRYGGVGRSFTPEQAMNLYPGYRESFDGVAAAYARRIGSTPLEKMTYVDHKTWLPDDLLIKADRMTMAHSLELRVPFLDHVLVEFAARLPERLKIRDGVSKYLLKKWAEPLLPREIVYRSKKGFPVPTKDWFRGDLSGFARETLLSSTGICRKWFQAPALERLLDVHEKHDYGEQIFSLLILDSWYKQLVQATSGERCGAGI